MTHLDKVALKKELEDAFWEMQALTVKVNSILHEVKGYVVEEEVLGHAERLIRDWSKIAERHAAASNELYNLRAIRKLSKYN